jgi:hypothetical protein
MTKTKKMNNIEFRLSIPSEKEFSGINVESLPSNIHILTLEKWG